MIWSFTRAMGYSTTVAPGLTAAGAGRGGSCWGASMGPRYLGTSTWPCAQLPDIAATASSSDATPLPPTTRRRAAFLHRLRIVFPELKIVNLKRSLSLPLPEPAIFLAAEPCVPPPCLYLGLAQLAARNPIFLF